MVDRRLHRVVAALILLGACSPRAQQQANPQSPVGARTRQNRPSTQATVVTIRTTLQPANRTTTHTVVIAGSKARSTDEAEMWRLYDLRERTVTFVNDIEKTWRREPIATVLAKRRAALRRPVDRELPTAEYQTTGTQRSILGIPSRQSLVKLGGYRRELWFATHPAIPDELFSMMHASAEATTRLGAIVARADEELIAARGFPLLDRAEMPYGKDRMIVERHVVAIETKAVPADVLAVPDDYREVTEPAVSRPSVSSRPRGQSTPAAGSQPSATTQTSP
ncbi:MAG TPA: hypothetical protein VF057_01040 [Thermoanaerobaculia bacterium]